MTNVLFIVSVESVLASMLVSTSSEEIDPQSAYFHNDMFERDLMFSS